MLAAGDEKLSQEEIQEVFRDLALESYFMIRELQRLYYLMTGVV